MNNKSYVCTQQDRITEVHNLETLRLLNEVMEILQDMQHHSNYYIYKLQDIHTEVKEQIRDMEQYINNMKVKEIL